MPKKTKNKPSVKVDDLRSQKNPKGGAADVFLKLGDIKGESLDAKHKEQLAASSLKIGSLTNALANKIK